MKVVKVKPQSQTQHNRPHSVCQLARVSRFIFGMCVTFACKRDDWMFKQKSSKTQQKEWMQEQIQAGTWHWEKQHPTEQDLGLPKLYFFSWRASCCSFASRVTHLYEPLLPSIHSLRIRIYSGSQKHAGTITGVTLALAFLLKSTQCVSHQHMCILWHHFPKPFNAYLEYCILTGRF